MRDHVARSWPLREAWDAGDYSKFHGWDRRSPEAMPTSYVEPGKG